MEPKKQSLRSFVNPRKGVLGNTRACVVHSTKKLSRDVIALYLVPLDGKPLQYHAGQHVEFLLPGGERRAFSIANAPCDDNLIEFHIKVVAGGMFADYLSKNIVKGTKYEIIGPMGDFYLREKSPRSIIMVGAGTGFSPLKAMIERVRDSSMNCTIYLFIGAKKINDLYMMSLVESLKCQINFSFIPVISGPDAGCEWLGKTGLVHKAVLSYFDDLSEFDIYICGPLPMIDSAVVDFISKGASKSTIYRAQ